VMDAAKQAVVSLLGSIRAGSDLRIVRVPPGDSSPIDDLSESTRSLLDHASPTPQAATTWGLLDAGITALSQGSRPSGDLFVVSDFCGDAGAMSSPGHDLRGVRVRFVDVEGPRRNPYVGDVRLAGGTPIPGAGVRLEAELREVEAPLDVTLLSNDGNARRTTVESSGAFHMVSWLVSVGSGRPVTAILTLPRSPLSLDDTVYVAWQPVLQRRILLVADREQSESRLVATALQPEGEALPWSVKRIEPRLADAAAWRWAEAVVWIAAAEPHPPEPQPGILRFLGKEAAWSGGAAAEPFLSERAPVAIGRVSYGHPVFEAFTGTARGRMESPLFFFHHCLAVAPELVIARFADGWPAVLESGQGITVTSGLSDRETDWAVRGSFLPFLWETLSFLGGGSQRLMYTVGEEIHRVLPEGGIVQIVGPRGQRAAPRAGTDSTVSFVPEEPGLYRVLQDGAPVDVIAVNVDPRESDLTQVDVSALQRQLEQAGAHVGGRGGEWWHLVFVCLVVILACETVLSSPR
jgi:hypothetical protein